MISVVQLTGEVAKLGLVRVARLGFALGREDPLTVLLYCPTGDVLYSKVIRSTTVWHMAEAMICRSTIKATIKAGGTAPQ